MSAKESDEKVLSSSSVRVLSGKCQRVEVSFEQTMAPEPRQTQRKVSASELLELIDETPLETNASQKGKKPNLSKYIDDNIRNFDPLAKRKERSSTCSSGENTTHSTSSNNSKGEKITEAAVSEVVKDKENIHRQKKTASPAKPTTSMQSSNVDTPTRKSKSKLSSSKFSVDAVDSPQGKAPPASSVSALAGALARSSTAVARSSKKIVAPISTETIVPVVVKERPAAVASFTSARAAPDLNTSVAEANHTATNTHAPTMAFKTSTEEPAPVAVTNAVSEVIEGKQKRVSFIAPAAPAPAAVLVQPQSESVGGVDQMKITPKSASTSHIKPSSSRKPTSSTELVSTTTTPHTAVPTSHTHSAGILSDSSRFIELNGRQYIRLNVLGKGGSSCVYRIIGADDGQVYAYKRVEVRDSEDVDAVFDSYANEIALLRRLSVANNTPSESTSATVSSSSHSSQSRIIELVDFEVRRDQRYIAMILEAGDIDLAKVLTQKNTRTVSSSGVVSGGSSSGPPQALLDPFFARMAWREMLEAVDHIHQHRIVHGDLKPANFVFVKGHLKLIDFGIAKSFNSDTTNIYRESQIGTINYMAPEAIAPMSQEETDEYPHSTTNDNERLKMRLGRASDIWSLGCILYQMVYGRPPFAALNTIQKLSTIPNPKHVIKYSDCGDADAVGSMQACLKHDARLRSKIKGPGGLLEMPYLQVPHNSSTVAGVPATPSLQQNVQQLGAIGKEQVTCIVGAVLDSLHATATDSVETAQANGRAAGTRSTRSGRGNADADAALKLAQGIVQWIDAVHQESVEEDVMQVVREQNWPTEKAPVSASAPEVAEVAVQVQLETTPPSAAVVSTSVTAAAIPHIAASPGSPYLAKRKAPEDAPGSVTRSAVKAKRVSQEPSSVQKSTYKNFDISSTEKKPLNIPTTASKTPSRTSHLSQQSPRALTMRPTFLHGLGAKIPVFPNLHAAVTAPSLRTASTNSSSDNSTAVREPLKAMPLSLQQQILNSSVLNRAPDQPVVDRASKWMKPPKAEEGDMKSSIDKQISALRKFMDTEQDNTTCTETIDITGFFF